MISRHNWTLLIYMLLSLCVHRSRPIDAIPQIIMMLLKMMDLLVSRVGGAHRLLSASHVVRNDFASICIRLLN